MIKTITLPRPKKQTNISRCPPSRTMDDVASIQFQLLLPSHIEEYFSYHEEHFHHKEYSWVVFAGLWRNWGYFHLIRYFLFWGGTGQHHQSSLCTPCDSCEQQCDDHHCPGPSHNKTHTTHNTMMIIVLASSYNTTHTCIQDNFVCLLENISAHSWARNPDPHQHLQTSFPL